MPEDFRSPLKPPSDPSPPPTLVPAIVPFLAAWLGLLTLLAALALPLLPGSRHPRAELEHREPYSLADRFIPIPIYATVVVLFLAIVTLWQMRKEPRPLPAALLSQRLQACVAILLSVLAIIAI